MIKILIVEDDITFSQILDTFLTKKGYETTVANTIKAANKFLEKTTFDLLLLDYRLPDGIGLDILTDAKEKGIFIPAIIMTSFNDVKTAVNAMRSGALDYITKPVNPEELLMTINSALERKNIPAIKVSKPNSNNNTNNLFIKGVSEESKRLYNYVDLVAPTDMSVVIQGDSGTGKEHIAKAIHDQSARKDKPFVAIDCGALSKELAASELFGHVKGSFTGAFSDKVGQFEAANGGTLFLDEVGNLTYDVQVKLLRTLQEKIIQPIGSTKQIPVDVRIVAATNDDLLNSVSNGDFREDLYHRVNEFKILMPALKNRGKDLQLFINHFISLSNEELNRNVQEISEEVEQLLYTYDWPGNLRELKNVIKRMVLLTPNNRAEITALPEEMSSNIRKTAHQPNINTEVENSINNISGLKEQNEVNEKTLIIETLEKVRFNKSKAAKILNIDRKTLYNKMDKYGIE